MSPHFLIIKARWPGQGCDYTDFMDKEPENQEVTAYLLSSRIRFSDAYTYILFTKPQHVFYSGY